ncbi:MAG: hypothetical protein M5U34_16700, partial [Chloroflexi bacterium]|nr:hypothetical protein [Chloroflexota bacterium]
MGLAARRRRSKKIRPVYGRLPEQLQTTGGPIASPSPISIMRNGRIRRSPIPPPRPGHADLTGAVGEIQLWRTEVLWSLC